MFSFPAFPPFEGLHPLVVHFPVALILTVWIPAIIGLFLPKQTKSWYMVTLFWLALGVFGAMFSVVTGEAAEEIAVVTTDAAKSLLHEHEEAGELVRTVFVFTFLLSLTTFLLRYVWSSKKVVIVVAAILTTLGYVAGCIMLVNVAHQGGVLVHHHHIHAPISP